MIAKRKPGLFRVNKENPCPICKHTAGCAFASDLTAVFCMRIELGCAKRKDGSAIQAKSGMGWLHELTGPNKSKSVGKGFKVEPSNIPKLSRADMEAMLATFRVQLSEQKLKSLSECLRVSCKALRAYGAGWDQDHHSYTFPMYDGSRKVCGIHLRNIEHGRKLAISGSRQGLFIPEDYDPKTIPAIFGDPEKPPILMVLPEGVSDCCAIYDLGGPCAVGRPSNRSGSEILLELLSLSPKQQVVLIADRDETKFLPDGTPHWPGIEGALTVAETILEACEPLQFCLPPEGSKDFRQWAIQGGTQEVFYRILGESKVVSGKNWIKTAWKRIEDRRVKEKKS